MPDFTLLELGAAALATWRLAVLTVYDTGPFRLFVRLRERLGFVYNDDGDVVSWPDNWLVSLITCVWCMSFWTTLAVCGILWVEPYIVMVLAVWGAATLMEALRNRR
ncbi:hypothetical protein LCGC14_2111500 [marine sediment metagenome]|uniref:DUF1360 domain-containing protein n=1 Tax=marine sediment metagenome TaxID=412755 RepID=A0A0F9GK61_9ZZZZ